MLGYVVERQRTPGEWVRVWTGRTLWFDHDEAVLERDAYALDGIPARIRGVYLGAPAPAEATEASGLRELVAIVTRRRERRIEQAQAAEFDERYRYSSLANELEWVLEKAGALIAAEIDRLQRRSES